MSKDFQIFMLSDVKHRSISTAAIIKQTFLKHFHQQQQQPDHTFRIYVFAENSAELMYLNSLLWGDNGINRNEILQFYPHFFINNNNHKNSDNQIFYETLIFYTPIVLSANYNDLIQTNNILSEYYKKNIESIVIFIGDDRQEMLPSANDISDYFDFSRFSTLVDIIYKSPIAIKNGRIRYRKYQQKNLKIQHLVWDK